VIAIGHTSKSMKSERRKTTAPRSINEEAPLE
jgi:hypothetical protein